MPGMKTIRVRIAVAVDPGGSWSSCGWQHADNAPRSDEDKAMDALDTMSAAAVVHFVEADIPLPTTETIEGEVTT
jgi:hypothetical protein